VFFYLNVFLILVCSYTVTIDEILGLHFDMNLVLFLKINFNFLYIYL